MFRRIYISGTMEKRIYAEVKAERDETIYKLTNAGFAACDPLRKKGKHHRGGKTKMNLAKTDYEVQQIISRDENDVRSCDAVVILTGDTPTSGTWFEFAYAHYVCKIPVIVIAPKMRKEMDKKGGAFEWTGGKASKVVSNIDEAVEALVWLFGDRYEMPRSDS